MQWLNATLVDMVGPLLYIAVVLGLPLLGAWLGHRSYEQRYKAIENRFSGVAPGSSQWSQMLNELNEFQRREGKAATLRALLGLVLGFAAAVFMVVNWHVIGRAMLN